MNGIIIFILTILIAIFSILLMFYWEGKVRTWLRLPGINLILLVFILVAGFFEQIYLTFHPEERTKYIKTSIYQIFFL